MMRLSRRLYALLLCLNGTLDHARIRGIEILLKSHSNGHREEENRILSWLVSNLPTNRMFKLFDELRKSRVNNSKARRIILRSILQSERLELWAVKYRKKIQRTLIHAWGKKKSSMIVAIAKKPQNKWNEKERSIIVWNVGKRYSNDMLQIIRFIFGDEIGITLPLLTSYIGAKKNLELGKNLPYEVLEGIRSTYHKDIPHSQVFELCGYTTGQKLSMQSVTEQHGVEVKFDPNKYDMLRLYLFAYQRGMTEEILQALVVKAHRIGVALARNLGNISIIVDCSKSMEGDSTQPMRPIAIAMALRDILQASAKISRVYYAGGQPDGSLMIPWGDTCLGFTLVKALADSPESIFIITDGYENAPEGRFSEVVEQVRSMRVSTPIYQLSPVMSAECLGTRDLSTEVPCLPVGNPQAIGVALMKNMLAENPKEAITGLCNLARFQIEGGQRKCISKD